MTLGYLEFWKGITFELFSGEDLCKVAVDFDRGLDFASKLTCDGTSCHYGLYKWRSSYNDCSRSIIFLKVFFHVLPGYNGLGKTDFGQRWIVFVAFRSWYDLQG